MKYTVAVNYYACTPCRAFGWFLPPLSKIRDRMQHVFRSVFRPSVIRPLTRIWRDAIISVLSVGILTKLGINIHHGEWALLKRFLKSRGQTSMSYYTKACECYSGGGIYFDSVASRLSGSVTCLISLSLDTDVGFVLDQEYLFSCRFGLCWVTENEPMSGTADG